MHDKPTMSRSRMPRYLQLATLFRAKIVSGDWPVDARIPNVDDLAAEFDVARGTIREAMGELEKEGLVLRVRGKGSFVRSAPGRRPLHHLESDWASLIASHGGAEIRLLEHERVDAAPAPAGTQGQPAKSYEMMRRLHLRDGQPYLLGRAFLCSEVYAQVPERRFREESTLPILHELLGSRISQAAQTLTIDAADLDSAQLLEVPLNAPVARVVRTVVDNDGTLIFLSEGIYRGDAMKLHIKLR